MKTINLDESMPATAYILAGGLGTRLRPLVADRPKALVSVNGQPFLDYLLNFLVDQGITQVVLCAGYLSNMIYDYAQNTLHPQLQLRVSEEQAPLGTGGALRQASLAESSPFFALNGDTLFLIDLRSLWRFHKAHLSDASLALLDASEVGQRGYVNLAEDGYIQSFQEKTSRPQPALVNGGIYILTPRALSSISSGQPVSLERQVFPELAKKGLLTGQVQKGYFVDIGTPESLKQFERDVQSGVLI
jgi:D-glycero-alpha-D-manno-heptose 1-phosphate guanylyltransferase